MTSAAPLIDQLRACSNLLCQKDGLKTFASQVHNLLRSLTPREVLNRALGPDGRSLGEYATGYLHLGFLAPFGTDIEEVKRIALEAGFDQPPMSFASEVMSRELALLADLEAVPTRILKVFATAEGGQRNGFEAFLPDVSEAQLSQWVSQAVGTHLGIGLKQREQVWEAIKVCREAGFVPPDFLCGKPAVNQAEDILVMYADGELEGLPLRLELYHTTSESPLDNS